MFQVVFTPLVLGPTNISIQNIDLKANDGFATTVPVSNNTTSIVIATTSNTKDIVKSVDSTNLHALAAHDKNIFNDRWFIAFDDAIDASVIDHYEILETSASSISLLVNPDWRPATSPVVLQDQSRSSYVYIRAIGRDGSTAYNVVQPEKQKITLKDISMYGILLIVLISFVFIYKTIKKFKK